ncbi:MAG: ATP-binding protein [Spirochaetes bacterium]|nr:ATP-binding protein [Spirochaetota bacterium]
MKNFIAAAPLIALLLIVPAHRPCRAAAPRPPAETGSIMLTAESARIPLGLHIAILEDRTGALTIREASSPEMADRYVPCRTESPSFGFNSTDYWVRFSVTNTLPRDDRWFLELEYPHMDVFEAYYKDRDGSYMRKQTGDIYKFDRRELRYRNFVFSIAVPRGKSLTVYLHFAGSCSKQFPLTLWSPEAFAEKAINEKLLLGVYYGIIIVMMCYNLILFFFIRDRSYLLYVIYIATYGMVQMAYNGMAFEYLWPDLPWWHRVSLPFLIGLAILWMAIFTQSFLHLWDKARAMFWSMVAIMVIGIMTMVYSVLGDYLTAIESAMKLMVFAAVVTIVSAVVSMARGYRPARFFLMAWLFFLCGLVLIALNKLNVIPVMFITEYANQIGSALEVTLLSVALADRINIMNQEKKEAQRATIQAQEKYKLLVEGSSDIIFSLDEEWNFITANNAIMTHLKVNPGSIVSMNFLDLIYDETDDAAVSKNLVREKLGELLANREPLGFKVMFKSTIIAEPKEMQVRLEYINIEGKNEILGKATSVEEDVLIPFIDSEQQNFLINNYIMAAEDVTQRLTRNLKKYMEQKQASLLRIALRELVINAIEHGNLSISFNEKSEAIMNDTYFTLIANRRQDPRYRDRKVLIEYSLSPSKVVYRITDEGDGFSHGALSGSDARDASANLLSHGRGISMAKNIFDSVAYNEKGNQVTLLKKFARSA